MRNQLKKLKTAVKKDAGTTLRMILKIFDGNDLPHVLFLTTRQRAMLRNAFNNNMSSDAKLSKAQISKIAQSGEFLGSLLSILAVPLIKVPVLLAKKYFSSIRKNSGCFSNWCRDSKENTWFRDNYFNNFKWRNEWLKKIAQALESSNILLKGVTKTIENETKKQNWGFLSMLLGTLGAGLLGSFYQEKEQ